MFYVCLTPGSVWIEVYVEVGGHYKLFSDDFNKVEYLESNVSIVHKWDCSSGQVKYAPEINAICNAKYPYTIYVTTYNDYNIHAYCKNKLNKELCLSEALNLPDVIITQYKYNGDPPYPQNILVYRCKYHQIENVLKLSPKKIVVTGPAIDITPLYTCNVKAVTVRRKITKYVAVQLLQNTNIKRLRIKCTDDLSNEIAENTSLIDFSQNLIEERNEKNKVFYFDIMLRNWKMRRSAAVKSARNV